MDNEFKIMQDLIEKYSEWLEMAGDESPALLIKILLKVLTQEKNQNEYLKKLLKL